MAQTVVTKRDLPSTTPLDGTVTYMTSDAIPIHAGEGIHPELQVPKVATTQAVDHEAAVTSRPAPIHISVDAVPVVTGITVSPKIKEIVVGEENSSSPTREIIVHPPMPATHVGTRSSAPRYEPPSE